MLTDRYSFLSIPVIPIYIYLRFSILDITFDVNTATCQNIKLLNVSASSFVPLTLIYFLSSFKE
ncbi:MAG: hypothetical protein WBO36_09975 [Saprospiraceae bacterium]